jgi:hypothetical protein
VDEDGVCFGERKGSEPAKIRKGGKERRGREDEKR